MRYVKIYLIVEFKIEYEIIQRDEMIYGDYCSAIEKYYDLKY